MRLKPHLLDLERARTMVARYQVGERLNQGLAFPLTLASYYKGHQLRLLAAELPDHRPVLLPCFVRNGRLGALSLCVPDFTKPIGLLSSGELGLAASHLSQAAAALCTLSFQWVLSLEVCLRDEEINLLRRAGIVLESFNTYLLDLSKGYDAVFSEGYNSTQRNQVRRSHREDAQTERCRDRETAEQFGRLYSESFVERAWYGRPYPTDFFCAIAGGVLNHVDLLVAKAKGRVIAGGVFVTEGDCVHYILSAVDRAARSQYPVSQVLDYAIRLACERGALRFDLGGVPSEDSTGLIAFKKSWGAVCAQHREMRYNSPLLGVYARCKGFLRRQATSN